MSLPMRYDPFSRNYFWNMMERPLRIFDQNFGGGLFNDDLLEFPSSFYGWPTRRDFPDVDKTGVSEIQYDKDKYQVMLDVQHFKSEEINVTTANNAITIKGHHEEKQDHHGHISRSFTRRYVLPEDIKVENLECNLSTDGVLTLKAPRLNAIKDGPGRAIPIVATGKPALKEKAPANGPATEKAAGGDK